MAYLLSIDPSKELAYVPELWEAKLEDEKPTEKLLFEALWICVKAIPPSGAELEQSLTLKQELRAKSIEGGSIKLAVCPCCNQRWMQHGRAIRTIEQPIDLILDDDVFMFLKACPDKWQSITGELQEHFRELKKRFKAAEAKSPEAWRKILAERYAEPNAQ